MYYCLFTSHPVQLLKFIVLCTKRAGIVFAVFTWYDLTRRNHSKLGLDREYHSFSKTVHRARGLLQRTGNTDHARLLASAHIHTLNIAKKFKKVVQKWSIDLTFTFTFTVSCTVTIYKPCMPRIQMVRLIRGDRAHSSLLR